MPGTAAKVSFPELQMEMLEEIVASKTASVRLVERAQIVLLAYQKRNNEQISENRRSQSSAGECLASTMEDEPRSFDHD